MILLTPLPPSSFPPPHSVGLLPLAVVCDSIIKLQFAFTSFRWVTIIFVESRRVAARDRLDLRAGAVFAASVFIAIC
jgi:hypothetical protein